MKTITRREFALLAVSAIFAVPACSSQDSGSAEASQGAATDTAQEQEKEPVQAAPGDAVSAATKYGDVTVKIDAFSIDSKTTKNEREYGSLGDGLAYGVLTLVLENDSYSDPYNEGFVYLGNAFRLEDADGVTIGENSSGWDFGQYSAAAGAFARCAVGQTVRIAISYVVDETIETVTVHFPDSDTVVPLSVEQA